jgi:glycosyltransferase involved in cell wall biosynthesis
MRVYLPQIEKDRLGGGWTFVRNIHKGMQGLVDFVDQWQDCDVFFIPGVTMVERDVVEQAHAAGKPIVFRMDNIPRKSRNKRNRVYDNVRRYAELAHTVVYQSHWAMDYCMPMSGPGVVVYNGVDQEVFYPAKIRPGHPRYLFAYHGKNEVKGFWLAHYLFQRWFRLKPESEFWFIYNFKSELSELIDANYDFWNGEKFRHLEPVTSQVQMAELLRQCTHLIYPAFCDAAPNMVLEARACGLQVMGTLDPAWSGVDEMLNPQLDISLERMCDEYKEVFFAAANFHKV